MTALNPDKGTDIPPLVDADLPAGVIPQRTSDAGRARRWLAQDGAAILTGVATDSAAATHATRAVLGARLRAYRAPVDIAPNPEPGQGTFFERTARTVNADRTVAQPAHTDGYMAFGNAYPDLICLLCTRRAESGGESSLIDGYRVLQNRTTDTNSGEMARFLAKVPIEQSTPTGVPARGPIAMITPTGCVALRHHDHQRPCQAEPDAAAASAHIARWHEIVADAAAAAPRFPLQPGELLLVDNYRMFHAREAYQGNTRLLRRIWAWTDRAIALPDPQALGADRVADLTFVSS